MPNKTSLANAAKKGYSRRTTASSPSLTFNRRKKRWGKKTVGSHFSIKDSAPNRGGTSKLKKRANPQQPGNCHLRALFAPVAPTRPVNLSRWNAVAADFSRRNVVKAGAKGTRTTRSSLLTEYWLLV